MRIRNVRSKIILCFVILIAISLLGSVIFEVIFKKQFQAKMEPYEKNCTCIAMFIYDDYQETMSKKSIDNCHYGIQKDFVNSQFKIVRYIDDVETVIELSEEAENQLIDLDKAYHMLTGSRDLGEVYVYDNEIVFFDERGAKMILTLTGEEPQNWDSYPDNWDIGKEKLGNGWYAVFLNDN